MLGRSVVWLRDATANQRGNVAIIFALTAVPVILMLGLVVDFSRSSGAQEQLQAAADAAVLAAATHELSAEELKSDDGGVGARKKIASQMLAANVALNKFAADYATQIQVDDKSIAMA